MSSHRFKRAFLLIALFIHINGIGYAETLTLEQSLEWAIQNNPELKSAQARLGISEADILSAAARLNPNLISDNGLAEDTYRLGIEQTMELGGKRQKRILVAKAQKQVVLKEIDQAVMDLRMQVRRAYGQLFYAQQRQLAYQEILTATEKLLEIAKKREQAGDIALLDVLQANIATVNASNDYQTIVNQVTEAWNNLNAAIYKPLEHRYDLNQPEASFQTTLALPELVEIAFNTRPELKQIEENMAVTEAEYLLYKANRVPNLSLTIGPDFVIPGGGNNQTSLFAIANVGLPLWNRQQGPIQKTIAKKTQLALEREALKNRVNLEVSNAYNSLVTQQTRLMHYETEILPKAQEVVEKARRSFEEGKSNILVPINAQQAYINARLGYLQTLADLQNAISDLERAVGITL